MKNIYVRYLNEGDGDDRQFISFISLLLIKNVRVDFWGVCELLTKSDIRYVHV